MIVMITGGQRSGKSSYAEGLLQHIEDVGYIATAKIEDEEMAYRVKKHKDQRPGVWATYEGYRNFKGIVGDEEYYILECVGTMVSNILYEHTKDIENITDELIKQVEDDIEYEITDFLDYIKENDKNLLIVTNEVGLSLTPENRLGRIYTDILGRVNQKIGGLCDKAYLIVAGMELRLK